jgi:hypothetical protein
MLETTLTKPAKPAIWSRNILPEITYRSERQQIQTVSRLPTQDELPCDDGVPMETERHRLQWIGACQSTYKKGFPCPFCSLTTAPGCNALAALRPLSSFTKERSYLNGSTPSGTFQKKCQGYQRLLVTAYRLP